MKKMKMMKKKKKMTEKKESTSGQIVFTANAGVNPTIAVSGVFPDDFSMVLNRSTGVVSFLVNKHLANDAGMPTWFDSFVTADNELVEISILEAKSIAELELKLDLHNLVWQ